MPSLRTRWDLGANALAGAVEAARASGRPLLDLAESNPTRVGLAWPPEALAIALGDPRIATYDPTPRGHPEARAAVARYLASRGAGAQIAATDVVQPGFFYDFERRGQLVISLLPEPAVFRAGLALVEARLRRCGGA